MKERKKPLRWRKEPNEQGLAIVGQSPRGLELRQNGEILVKVVPYTKNRWDIIGWFFYSFMNDHSYNSLDDKKIWKEQEGAKKAAETWVKEKLKEQE